MQTQDFYPANNDYITSPANNGSKLMMSGYNSTGKRPLRDSLVMTQMRTRNESGPAKLSLSLTNGNGDLKLPPKSGMSKNDMQYLTPQLSNRPSTSANPGSHGRNQIAQAFRERVKS